MNTTDSDHDIECAKQCQHPEYNRPVHDKNINSMDKSESIICIQIDQSFKPDILGINRMDNNVHHDTELYDDNNWWISEAYYNFDDEIEFEYDLNFVDYGVIV